jgi:hypothetical protein
MTGKERVLQIVEQLPDDSSLEDIVACLRRAQELNWDAEELSADEWHTYIAHTLKDELNDPREDIYTLEHGEPIDESR